MTRSNPSGRPPAILNAIATLRRRMDSAGTIDTDTLTDLEARVTVLEAAPTGAIIDAMERTVKYTVLHTALTPTVAASVNVTLDTLPAGVKWTHVWIEPTTLFVSAGLSTWLAQLVVPATGASAGGSPKNVNVTLPDALAQQAAAWYVQCDFSAPVTLEVNFDSGGETADNLTAGSVNIYVTLSIPGATTDTLPHA